MSHTSRKPIKLSLWAKRNGVNLRTAQRMHQRGELPVPAFVTDTGRIMVVVEDARPELDMSREELVEEVITLRGELRRLERRLDQALIRHRRR